MIDLQNDLTLNFVHIVHGFQMGNIDIKFQVLPTLGTTVATTLDDWKEFQMNFEKGEAAYDVAIGKSKDDIWTLLLGEWTKYITYQQSMDTYTTAYNQWVIDHDQWLIDVQNDPNLAEPQEPSIPLKNFVLEAEDLFDYISSVGIK